MHAKRVSLWAGAATAVGAVLSTTACTRDTAAAERVQGWSVADRDGWYYATQGSRLMPLAWFDALERAESTAPFADEAHLATGRHTSES